MSKLIIVMMMMILMIQLQIEQGGVYHDRGMTHHHMDEKMLIETSVLGHNPFHGCQ